MKMSDMENLIFTETVKEIKNSSTVTNFKS